MQEQAMNLAEQLQKILEDPSISAQETFLRAFADNGILLSHTVEQSQTVR